MDRRGLTTLVSTSTLATALAPALTLDADAAGPDHRRGPHRRTSKIVVAHRGASGYRPEHTIGSYTLAAQMGADFIEPDLVITKDGVLVCRHEPEISGTTDVAGHPEFASRKTTKMLDGKATTGWFVEDFTLAELKTLRAVERLPQLRQHNTLYNGQWQVPTFEEVLNLRADLSRRLGRTIGVYPETKHPTYFRAMGKPLEPTLVRMIRRHGLDRRTAPIFVQSFELNNLLMMRDEMRVQAPLVFLTSTSGTPFGDKRTYAELTTRKGMASYADKIDGLGPDLKAVLPWNADGTLGKPTSYVADAHANGLSVCPWEIRPENSELPADYRVGSTPSDYGRALDFAQVVWRTGIDGLFADTPDIALLARQKELGIPLP